MPFRGLRCGGARGGGREDAFGWGHFGYMGFGLLKCLLGFGGHCWCFVCPGSGGFGSVDKEVT